MGPDGEGTALDDVKGTPLDPDRVKTARTEEITYIIDREVYEPRTREESKRVMEKEPINTGWVDTNKGDDAHPNYRSSLVGKEFRRLRRAGREQLFAATPPSECLRLQVSEGVIRETKRRKMAMTDPIEYIILDVRRAHFYARAIREVYVRMPAEDPR